MKNQNWQCFPLSEISYKFFNAETDTILFVNFRKFDIFLTQGFAKQKIAFLFNPRFNENAVVRNTKDGKWGKEEKNGGFPFRVGESFKIEISAGHKSFRVS